MTSVSKCTQTLCPLASTCYRVQGPDGVWQSYMAFEYKVGPDGVTCDNYLEWYPSRTVTTDSTVQEE